MKQRMIAAARKFYKAMRQKKSIVVGITVLLIFTSVEASLRVRQYIRYGVLVDDDDICVEDPIFGKVFRPGASISGITASVTINRWGFRGHDFPLEKSGGVFRIFVLGDSVVFDRNARNDDTTWTARLEKELNGAQSKYRVEIVNAGVPGFYIDTEYLYLVNRISRFKPDMIILYDGANDINYQSRVLYGSPDKKPDKGLLNLAYLREKYFVWFNILRSKTASLIATEQKSAKIDRIGDAAVNNYAAGVEKVVRYCRKNNIRLIISTVPRSFSKDQPGWVQAKMAGSMMVYNPYLSLAGLNDAFDRFNSAIRNVCGNDRVCLVDSASMVPAEEKYFRDHVHFTAEGEKLISGIFAKAIAGKYLN